MNKEKILKKLKSQKGLTGADVAIAVSILVMTVVVVTMIYVNIDVGNKSINRTSGATRIATNILENIKLEEYENVVSKDSKTDGNKMYNTKIPNGYHTVVTVEELEDSDLFKLVKKVDVSITYKVGNEEKNISVSTAIESEFSMECNEPKFSENFLKNSMDYETKLLAGKIFVPIKYSYISNKYIVTTENDDEWYNYSSKEWAKALVFPDETIKNQFVDNYGNINTSTVEIDSENKTFKDYLYVWIPNFGCSEDTTLPDSTVIPGEYYFRAGAGSTAEDKNAITFQMVKEVEQEVDESIEIENLNAYKVDKNITFKESGENAIMMSAEGFWRLYNSAPEENTVYGKLTGSKYGPMIIH